LVYFSEVAFLLSIVNPVRLAKHQIIAGRLELARAKLKEGKMAT